MTVDEKRYELRAMIGWEANKAIRDTVEDPYDFYRAVEFAIRTLCRKAKIVLKSVFVPIVKDSKFYTIRLDEAGALGFEIVSPKCLYALQYDGTTIMITEEEVENVVSDTYNLDLELYRVALRKLGTERYLQTNMEVGSQPQAGSYNTIKTLPTQTKIQLTSGTSTEGYYVVNLSKANSNKYSYGKITNVSTDTLTLDITHTNPGYLWAVNEKILLVESLPILLVLVFQGLPKAKYFDGGTYTIIPVDDVYLDFIDDLALQYLYRIISGRIPEFTKRWGDQITIAREAITEAKKVANGRSAFAKVKPWLPTTIDYGR